MTADPLRLDADALELLTTERFHRIGVRYAQEHRVTDLSWEEDVTVGAVWAVVEGDDGVGYTVSVTLPAPDEEPGPDADAEPLRFACDCDLDTPGACPHAIATLIAYATRRYPVTEDDGSGAGAAETAAEEAIRLRVERGRTEVKVKHVGGDKWFGRWEARSLAPYSKGVRQVQIRSLGERLNHCTCPDLRTNQLGTCKHIEAVLHRLRQRAPNKFARLAARGPSVAIVALDWSAQDGPQIRLRRPAEALDSAAEALLDQWFDAAGRFTGRLPDGWHRFARSAAAHEDIALGDDIGDYIQRLDEQARRAERCRRIAEQVRASGGHLPGVRAKLFPYQVEGVAFLAGNGRALLADDMGLGKTLQAICACHILVRDAHVRRVLVVCPASLKHHWAREIERFTDHSVRVVQGGPKQRLEQYDERATFTVVNYELVMRDADAIQRHLAPDVLLLDEAQRIKNWRTKTAAAVKSLDTPYAFVLTGTPLENRLEDLYSLLQVVDPRVLGPLWRMYADHCITDGAGKVLAARNTTAIRARIAPVVLRRDRSLVRDQLPDRVDVQRDVPMTPRQRSLHDGALATATQLRNIANRRPLTPSERNRLMMSLQNARMACDAAGLVDKESVGSPKLDELMSLLEELCVEGKHKAVVFSQWKNMTRMAADVCEHLGLDYVWLHGGVPTSKRGELVDRFNEDPSVRVFLSTDAGGTGLNLQVADVLINLDIPWNPAVLDQRIARIHRLGQRQASQVFLLVAESSFELTVLGIVQSKRNLFINVLTDEGTDDVVGLDAGQLAAALAALEPAEGDGDVPVATRRSADEVPSGVDDAEGVDDVDDALPEDDAPEDEDDAEAPVPEDALTTSHLEGIGEGDASPAQAVIAIQRILGDALEQIIASGGTLFAIVSRRDAVTDEQQDQLPDWPDIVVVDRRNWRALSRTLGHSGVREVPLGVAPADAPDEQPEPESLGVARDKLEAAELLSTRLNGEAVELASVAMLHALAVLVGDAQPPPPEQAAVWLFGSLLPQGAVSQEDATAISRAVALRGTKQIPDALASAVVADAAGLVARAAAPWA